MRLRPVLLDGVLGLVALALLATAVVLVRPLVRAEPAAVPSPPPSVLLLRAPGTPGGHVRVAAELLGWSLVDAPLSNPTSADLTAQDVLVLQGPEQEANEVLAALREVRHHAPSARLVLVGPLGLNNGGQVPVRDALRLAAVQTGADFVDPIGSRWLQAPRLAEDGRLTPQGERLLGERLAAALRRAEQVRSSTGS